VEGSRDHSLLLCAGVEIVFLFSRAAQWRVLQVMNDSDLLLRKGSKRGFFSGGAHTRLYL